MKWIARLFAIALAFWAIPLFLVAAVDMAVSRALLSTEAYRAAFTTEQFERELVPNLLTIIVEEAHNEGNAWPFETQSLVQYVDTEDWATITAGLIPQTWVRSQVELLIDVFDGIVSGNYEVLQRNIDLQALKQNIEGEQARIVVNRLLDAVPECTEAEISTLTRILVGATAQLPICNPPTEYRDQVVDRMTRWIGSLSQNWPNTVRLHDLALNEADMQGLHLLVEINWQSIALLFLCPTAILFLIVFLVVHTLRGFGRWLGIVVILSGLAILGMLFLLQGMAISSMTEVWMTQTPQERFFAQIMLSLLRVALLQSSSTLLLIAAAFFGIGFILLIVASYAPTPVTTLETQTSSRPMPSETTS